MKKLLFFAVLGAALGLSSCGGSGNKADNGLDSLFSQSKVDTLVVTTAELNGWQMNMQFERAMAGDSTLSKEQFVRGIKYVFAADTTTSFLYGMYSGFNMVNQIKRWESMDLNVNRELFLRKLVNILNDSVSEAYMQELQGVNYRLTSELNEAMRVYEKAKIESSPASLSNIERGMQYIDSLRAADNSVEVAASGVAYRIIDAGGETKVQPTDLVKAVYTGRTLDGRVFDVVAPENPRRVAVSTRIEGLKQVLPMLGAGGKATVVIPGKLAYGIDNMRRYNLGPNEPVVYEIEILEIEQPQ